MNLKLGNQKCNNKFKIIKRSNKQTNKRLKIYETKSYKSNIKRILSKLKPFLTKYPT